MDLVLDFKQAFYYNTQKNIDRNYIQELINKAKQIYQQYGEGRPLQIVNSLFDDSLLKDFFITGVSFSDLKQELVFSYRTVLIDYLWIHNMHYYFLDKEEIDKLETLKQRNDYKGKLFTKLLYLCENYLNQESYDTYNVIRLSTHMAIKQKSNECYEEFIRKTVGPVAKFVNQVVGKIKPAVFISFYKKNTDSNYYITEKSKDYITQYFTQTKHYLHLASDHRGSLVHTLNFSTSDILCKVFVSLIDQTLPKESLYVLLNVMGSYKYDAEITRLLDYLFNYLKGTQNVLEVINKGQPIAYGLIEFKREVENFLLDNFKKTYNLKNDENLNFVLYPMVEHKNINVYVKAGKQIFLKFIQRIYNEQSDNFMILFESSDTVIRDTEVGENHTKFELKVKNYYNFIRLIQLSSNVNSTDPAILHISPNFFDNDKALSRFYLTCYLINQSRNDEFDGIMFSVLNYMFQLMEKKFGLTPIRKNYIHDIDDRKEGLKQFLIENGFDSTSTRDYQIAFLDREVATLEEQERFPVLEQMGDAIYELVITEAELWDIKIYDVHEFAKEKRKYTSATGQLNISEKLELDKYYISYPFFSVKKKLEDYEKAFEYIDEFSQDDRSKSYLADSLEMLIGAIYFDKGFEEAIKFTKKIVFDTYPEFNKYDAQIIKMIDNPMFEINHMIQLSMEQLEIIERVKPSIKPILDDRWNHVSTELISMFGTSLLKFMTLRVLGNETLEARKRFSLMFPKLHSGKVNYIYVTKYIAYMYLNHGFKAAETAFINRILPNFINK